jgi:hypothetical protein
MTRHPYQAALVFIERRPAIVDRMIMDTPPYANDQIIDATMARALHADASVIPDEIDTATTTRPVEPGWRLPRRQ